MRKIKDCYEKTNIRNKIGNLYILMYDCVALTYKTSSLRPRIIVYNSKKDRIELNSWIGGSCPTSENMFMRIKYEKD